MINIKIEKLCNDVWLRSHAKFCRKNDIVRINDIKDKKYRVISNPIWSDELKDWDIKMEITQ